MFLPAPQLFALAVTVGPSAPTQPIADAIRSVEAPRGCLQRDQLAEQVAVWLGDTQVDARLSIEVREDTERADVAHFRVLRSGEVAIDRPFEPVPPDCNATHAALGLAIAIALDSTVLEEFVPAPPSPEPKPEPDTIREPEPPRGLRRVGLRLGATMAGGLHPAAGFGGHLLGQLQLTSRVSLRAGAVATRGLKTDVGSGRASLSIIAGRLDVCVGGDVRSARLEGCAGPTYGAAIAAGSDQPESTRSLSHWVAGQGGLAVTVPRQGPVAFALDLDLVVPVLRPDFVVTGRDTGAVTQRRSLPPVGGLLSVGVVFQSPIAR